jgi:hypothetical protein
MKIIFFLSAILFFIGCNGIPTVKNWANGWIGTNIERLKETKKNKSGDPYVQYWKDNNITKDYYLKNGNLIYVQPIRKDCLVYFEVDKRTNKIISYTLQGTRCYYIDPCE